MDGVQAVNFTLTNALPVSPSDHVGRAVGSQTQERDACMGGLGQRRAVVQGGCPRRAHGGHRGERGQGQPQGMMRGRAFVQADMHLQIRVVVHGHDQRCVAGTWTCHDVANAKFDEHLRDDGRSGM